MEDNRQEYRLLWWLALTASTCAGWLAALFAIPWLPFPAALFASQSAGEAACLAMLCAGALAGAMVALAMRAVFRKRRKDVALPSFLGPVRGTSQ